MSRLISILCGAGIGLTLLVVALGAAGGGHGSNALAVLFFAPVALLSAPFEIFSELPVGLCILCGAFLYPAYAILLHWGYRKSYGAKLVGFVMLFHIWALGWTVLLIPFFWGSDNVGATTLVFVTIAFTPLVIAILAVVYVVLKYPISKDECKQSGKHCRQCSYNLTSNVSGKCPECGTPVQSKPDLDYGVS